MQDEHLQPVQSVTPDERSRAQRLAITIVPVIVLIAVIGAAIFGGGRSADDPSDPQRPTAAPAEPAVEASLAPDVETLLAAGFPTRALGLPVHSVARAMALRDDGEIRDKVVAVAGWLTVPPEPDCGVDVCVDIDGPYGVGADCRRSTVLADDAEPVFEVRNGEATRLRDAGANAELRPQALPGPSLAGVAAGQIAPDLVIRPERAVVLGRFGDPRLAECRSSSSDCGSTFTIERVAWVDGSWRLRRPEIYPADVEPVPSGMVRWPTIDRAIRQGAIVLAEVIVQRDQLATIDPAADAAVPRDVDTIWYIRALLRPRGLDDSLGEVGWAVIDDDTAAVLASDPERTAEESVSSRPGAGPSPSEETVAIPERMLGLEVLDVETAQRLVSSGLEPTRLVAIDGWLTVAPDEPGCTDLPVIACPRRGDLSGTREPGGPTLAVETLPGTPLLGLTRQSPSLGTWTVPNRVALVGHVRTTSAGPVFTIERLAWLRTAARQRPILKAPGSLRTTWTREAAEAVSPRLRGRRRFDADARAPRPADTGALRPNGGRCDRRPRPAGLVPAHDRLAVSAGRRGRARRRLVRGRGPNAQGARDGPLARRPVALSRRAPRGRSGRPRSSAAPGPGAFARGAASSFRANAGLRR